MGTMHCIKVEGKSRKYFPFHRVYIVRYADKMIADRAFRYYIGIPLTGTLRDRVKKVVETITTETAQVGKFYDAKDTELQLKPLLATADNLLLIVPLRGSYTEKESKEATAGYMGQYAWTKVGEEGHIGPALEFFDAFASGEGKSYIHTPTSDVQPVCMACPRHAEHRAGMCHLGQTICISSLPLATVSAYKAAVKDTTGKELPVDEREEFFDYEFQLQHAEEEAK